MSSSKDELLEELKTSTSSGLSRVEASERRETFNVVDPPIKCPAWICCLLPCIKSIPSMKKFREIQPEDAEILRDGKWIRYDAAGLVRGDIIKVMEGDIIPADCVVMSLDENEMLVDMRTVTGEETTTSIVAEMEKLYYGGSVLQGSATAAVVAIGKNTLVSKLIQRKEFPPKVSVLPGFSEDEEAGISLIENRLS
mmetsp:Transcript_25970/g.43329  ORF Transcript_25970/g.43329 Transcript_25970/m.43329 type:complete len:196 (+) Transcript_25970:104-691(+)